jgi:hypothetical protein
LPFLLLAAQQASVALAANTKANPACVVPASGEATGGVNYMHDLPGGDVLIGAEKGLLAVACFSPPRWAGFDAC